MYGLSLCFRFLTLDFYMDRFIEALQFHGVASPSLLLLSVDCHTDFMRWLLLLSLQFTDRKTGSEVLNALSKFTRLVNGGAGI